MRLEVCTRFHNTSSAVLGDITCVACGGLGK
jgi:hypothetical protein